MDMHRIVNVLSDVINNRPGPLRLFDQIYMKAGDFLLQLEHVSRHLAGRRVIFIGDGDAVGLGLVHLHAQGVLESGPASVHILDFDQRIVNSVRRFAMQFDLEGRITAELYNVADPLHRDHWQEFNAFYTNPPFGASNEGRSVEAFLSRGIEAMGADAVGCIVIADHPAYSWTQAVLQSTQQFLMSHGFFVAELLPQFHHYHLDDAPDLTSCSLIVRRQQHDPRPYQSAPLSEEARANFYGSGSPLIGRYVIDRTVGGKRASRDIEIGTCFPCSQGEEGAGAAKSRGGRPGERRAAAK
jgi:predicted methyltransferase